MISYSQYKLLKEADEPPGTPPSGSTMPSPSTGLPPTGSPPTGGPPAGGLDMSGMSGMSGGGGAPPGGGMDSLMGGPTPDASAPTNSKAVELKYSNVWDAFEKMLDSISKK